MEEIAVLVSVNPQEWTMKRVLNFVMYSDDDGDGKLQLGEFRALFVGQGHDLLNKFVA